MWSLFRLSINTAPSVLSVRSFWGEGGGGGGVGVVVVGGGGGFGALEIRERNTALCVMNLKFSESSGQF